LIDNLIPITVREVVNMWNKNKSWAFFHFEWKYPFQTTQKALEHTNMLKFIDIPFSDLSWWQKQRVLIAKALISNPDIIVMDEPTSWVDLVAQKHFYDLLEHLNIKHNITIIIVSHDTNFIQEKIKRLWYIWKNNCDECDNRNIHIQNIKRMFSKQEIDFF
jgi:zinc transport system ATP-binding protein